MDHAEENVDVKRSETFPFKYVSTESQIIIVNHVASLPKSAVLINFLPLDIFCNCTARFVWDLVENPEYRFSHNEAQIWEKL